MIYATLFRFAPLGLIGIASVAAAQMGVSPPPIANPGNSPAAAAAANNMRESPSGRLADSEVWRDVEAHRMDTKPAPAAAGRTKDHARPAAAADLTVGAQIADNKGAEIGYIKSIDPDGVVVATVGGQVKVPSDAFGKNTKGLLIGMTKADFDKVVAQAVGG